MANTNIAEHVFDAVIIGAGGAGQRASLQLAESGLKVALVSKVYPTRSHTVSAQGGINAALGNMGRDDWRFHMYDSILGSDFLGDQDAIEYMCREAPATVLELEHMGLPFSRNPNGTIYQRSFGGQTLDFGGDIARRTCCAADRTGHALIHTLYQKNIEAKTHFYNEWFAIDLVKTRTGGVGGVIAMSIETGEVVFLRSRATILATGGAGRIFQSTTNARINTGDGIAMVLRAGYPVQDIEMWQFHPTGIAGCGVLVTEGVRGEGGYLLNANGERYMERYAPHMKDLSCRDVVSRCSMTEIREGRGCGPRGDHVLLKLDHLGEDVISQRLPGIRELAKTFANVDPNKEPIPVVPTCHYMMGGIPTNIYGQALTLDNNGQDQIIEGLYAAGECACVSVHGANRLGANSLLDIVVFGRASGLHVEEALRRNELPYPEISQDEIDWAFSRYQRWEHSSNGEDPAQLRAEMQKIMQEDFSVFRNGEDMLKGLNKLKELGERIQSAHLKDKTKIFNTMRMEAMELDNLYSIALATATVAEARKESRGAHARVDFPERDDKNWFKHSVYFENNDTIYSRKVNMKPHEVEPILLREREH